MLLKGKEESDNNKGVKFPVSLFLITFFFLVGLSGGFLRDTVHV